MKLSSIVALGLVIGFVFSACSGSRGFKKPDNNQIVETKISEFLYKLNKRKNLKKKRISYHLDATREYKNILEQVIVSEQILYGYIVINRSYISALDMEQDINNQESTLGGVDLVIVAKSENRSITLKAITIQNENLLTMDVIKLIHKKVNLSSIQNKKPLTYYDTIKYCKKENKTIPNEYNVDNIDKENVLFWSNKYTKNSDMAMVYDSNDKQFFEAIREDTFDAICVSK